MDTSIRKVLIESATGLVLNIVLVHPDGTWAPDPGQEIVDDGAGATIGGTWDGSIFVAPPVRPRTKADGVREKLRNRARPPVTLSDVVALLRDEHGITELE